MPKRKNQTDSTETSVKKGKNQPVLTFLESCGSPTSALIPLLTPVIIYDSPSVLSPPSFEEHTSPQYDLWEAFSGSQSTTVYANPLSPLLFSHQENKADMPGPCTLSKLPMTIPLTVKDPKTYSSISLTFTKEGEYGWYIIKNNDYTKSTGQLQKLKTMIKKAYNGFRFASAPDALNRYSLSQIADQDAYTNTQAILLKEDHAIIHHNTLKAILDCGKELLLSSRERRND